MPRTSERTRIIQDLETLVLWKTFVDTSDSDDDTSTDSSNDEELGLITEDTPEDLLLLLYGQRNLEPRTQVPKSRDWSDRILPSYDGLRFRQTLRVSHDAFAFILQRISGDPVFSSNPSANQLSVTKQLQIALFRFGRFGNAASLADVARTFGVSEGTVINSTRRVIKAIIRLEKRYLRWYTASEKEEMMKRIFQLSGFKRCAGLLDGTTIVLAEKPVKDGELYFNRKSEYGMNCQIIADLDARIRFFFLGYPASVHDSRCFEESKFCQHSDDFLDRGEYVLADSAYTLSDITITPFKKPASLAPDNAAFNKVLSSIRVRVEHCIGLLKGRFQSLRGMRQRIAGKKSAREVVLWVKACAILHNMILEVDPWDGESPERESSDKPSLVVRVTDEGSTAAAARRERIKKRVLSYNYI